MQNMSSYPFTQIFSKALYWWPPGMGKWTKYDWQQWQRPDYIRNYQRKNCWENRNAGINTKP